jgi:hypothetical protein
MINKRGMARAGAAMAACGTAPLLALTGCSSGSSSSLATRGTTSAAGATASAAASPSSSGPAHTISTPTQLDSYTRNPSLEKQMNVNGLREQVIKGSSERASDVLSAVYAQGNVKPGAGGNQQIFLFVGGHLANSDPASSIASFEQTHPSARVVSAGSLGGEAACVTTTAYNESGAMCVWFDKNSFGTLVSPTMSTAKLANTMDTVRPGIEHVGQ